MKKLLIILTLGLMFGQTKLETRLYPMSMDWSVNAEQFSFDLQSITGYNLNQAIINFHSVLEGHFPII